MWGGPQHCPFFIPSSSKCWMSLPGLLQQGCGRQRVGPSPLLFRNAGRHHSAISQYFKFAKYSSPCPYVYLPAFQASTVGICTFQQSSRDSCTKHWESFSLRIGRYPTSQLKSGSHPLENHWEPPTLYQEHLSPLWQMESSRAAGCQSDLPPRGWELLP